jgi:hypothetical protein
VRERFTMYLSRPERMWHFDALFQHLFVDRRRIVSLAA